MTLIFLLKEQNAIDIKVTAAMQKKSLNIWHTIQNFTQN